MPEAIREPRLGATSFDVADFKRTYYVGNVEHGITPEDVLAEAFWAYHSAKLKPWDRIELRADDGTWFGEYLVLDCSRTWAKVFPLRVVMLTTTDISQTQAAKANRKVEKTEPKSVAGKPGDYEVKFRGPVHKWSVVRKSDDEVISDSHPTKEMAEKWLTDKTPQAVTT